MTSIQKTDRQPQPLLQVRGLKKYFPITGGFFNRTVGNVRAVDDVTSTSMKASASGWSARAARERPPWAARFCAR